MSNCPMPMLDVRCFDLDLVASRTDIGSGLIFSLSSLSTGYGLRSHVGKVAHVALRVVLMTILRSKASSSHHRIDLVRIFKIRDANRLLYQFERLRAEDCCLQLQC